MDSGRFDDAYAYDAYAYDAYAYDAYAYDAYAYDAYAYIDDQEPGLQSEMLHRRFDQELYLPGAR